MKKNKNRFSRFVLVLFVILTSISNINATNYIKIPALGRSANLGSLYDARTETFGEFIFTGPIKKEFITTLETPYTYTDIKLANTISEKYNLFDIKAEFTISILFGLFTVSGSAKYLTEDKKSARESQGLMILKSRTKSQNLQIYYEQLKSLYNTALINQTEATHFVSGVQWGANVAISFSDSFAEDRSIQETDGSLAIAFDKLKAIFSVSGSAGVNVTGKSHVEASGFSMKIHGDVSLPIEFPRSFQEIQELVRRIPDFIRQSNGEKGVQLEYTLTPINQLKNYLSLHMKQDSFFNKLDESQDQKIIELFEKISTLEQKLYDLQRDFNYFKICATNDSISKLIALSNKFQTSKIQLKTKLKDATIEIRSGKSSPTKIAEIFDEYMDDEYNTLNVEDKLEDFKEAIAKIGLYKTFRDLFPNVDYVGHGGSLRNSLLKNKSGTMITYVMYMKPEFTKKDPISWRENSNIFLSTLYQPFNKLIVVDCDFNPEDCSSFNKTTIQQIFEGIVTIENIIEKMNHSPKNMDKTSNVIQMKALGRFAKLGVLYDARTDSFLSRVALKAEIPTSVITTIKNEDTETNIIQWETFYEKCKFLGVNPEQQFSITSKLFRLSRSGQYLDDNFNINDENSFCSGSKSVIHSQLTEEDTIYFQDANFPQSLAADVLMKIPATHFVSKIHYGYNTIFSIRFPQQSQKTSHLCRSDYLDKNAKILRQILIRKSSGMGYFSITSTPSTNETKTEKPRKIIQKEDLMNLDNQVRIVIYSDIQGKESRPEIIEGSEQLLHYFNDVFFPQQAKQAKGQPVAYLLTPIDNLEKSFGILTTNIQYTTITLSNQLPYNLLGYSDLQEQITRASTRIQGLHEKLLKYSNCQTESDYLDLKEIKDDFQTNFGNFTNELKDVTIRVKSKVEGIESLKRLKTKYEKLKAFGNDGRYLKLDKMLAFETKMMLCEDGRVKRYFNVEVQYMGKNARKGFFEQILNQFRNSTNPVYMLYYKPSWTIEKPVASAWLDQFHTFTSSLGNKSGIQGLIVDCEFSLPECENVHVPTIYEYRDGNFFVFDGKSTGVVDTDDSGRGLKDNYESLKTRVEKIEQKLGDFEAEIQDLKHNTL